MPSIDDWAAKAADRIDDEYPHARREQRPSVERIAAIVATFAEPILMLLAESRRSHHRGYNDESCDYPPCPASDEDVNDEKCTCGADAWNARIETALSGRKL